MSKYDYYKIASYVDGEIDPEERVAFEQEMERDPALRKEVELYMSIDHQGGLAATLGKLNKEHFPDAHKQTHRVVNMDRRKFYRRVASVAAVFIILVSGYFVIFHDRKSVQQMADEYVNTSLSEISSNSPGTVDSLQMGIQAY